MRNILTCSTCARADCTNIGRYSMPCPEWINTDDDLITDEDIDRDLAPLSRDECARRGIRHSSEDNT